MIIESSNDNILALRNHLGQSHSDDHQEHGKLSTRTHLGQPHDDDDDDDEEEHDAQTAALTARQDGDGFCPSNFPYAQWCTCEAKATCLSESWWVDSFSFLGGTFLPPIPFHLERRSVDGATRPPFAISRTPCTH
jgi:hypothetical protein